jgi:uncharacterized protein (UPF0210 family)
LGVEFFSLGTIFPDLPQTPTHLDVVSREGYFNLDSLLLYSAVCGTGLDTIPIPGDTSVDQIRAILTDVASLSIRWGKPLSARLFPVPGLGTGELTRFDSPYLTNTTVMAL